MPTELEARKYKNMFSNIRLDKQGNILFNWATN